MGYMEDVTSIRTKFQDALNKGLFDDKRSLELILINIMNEAERNRQLYVNQASDLRRQASVLDGQANGFSSLSSIINTVINGFVMAAERAEQMRQQNEGIEAEKAAYAASLKEKETTTVEEEVDEDEAPQSTEVKSVKKKTKK